MKLTQKRTCFGCKALNYKYIYGVKKWYCQLGYETGQMVGVPTEYLPVEPCPKPMTQKDWTTAKTSFHKNNVQSATLMEVAYIALDLVKTVLYNHPDDDIAQAQKEIIEKAITFGGGRLVCK